jgi:hypothetical protein
MSQLNGSNSIDVSQGAAYTALTTPFLGTDTLACIVWRGGALASVATPSVAWIDAGVGAFRITFAAADTSSLDVGLYQYEVTITRSSVTATIDRGRIKLVAKAGSDINALAFTTMADLKRYCPWIEDLEAEGSEFGFADQQVRATNRLITALVNLWKPGSSTIDLSSGTSWITIGPSDPPSRWLREQLVPLTVGGTVPVDMDYRTVTSANYIDASLSTALLLYDEVKEVCAKWSIGYVLAAQIGCNNKMEWDALSARFSSEARSLFFRTRFEVDLNDPQTGIAGIVIQGGNTSLR